jgi:3-oxoacyl-[acyl-carrier protein] reductase
MFSARGRTALVTGAGRGLGRATAAALAAVGAYVICAYSNDADAANDTVEQIRTNGGSAGAARVDVTELPVMAETVNALIDEHGAIDILVNNAAIRPRRPTVDITLDDWETVMAVNLRGPFFLTQAVLPAMLARQWGRIINISGLDAYRGGTNRVHVSASKLGLSGMTRALATETAAHGVTVNVVVPGLLSTKRDWSDEVAALFQDALAAIPMARLGEPDEVAHLCVYLASQEASFMTGQELFVSGGAHPLIRQYRRDETT